MKQSTMKEHFVIFGKYSFNFIAKLSITTYAVIRKKFSVLKIFTTIKLILTW